MSNRIALLGVLSLVLASTGCAVCSSPFDYDYSAYGGTWDREERCRGRVGSAFDPAESRLVPIKPNAENDAEQPADDANPAPTPPDEEMTPPDYKPDNWSPKSTPRRPADAPPEDAPPADAPQADAPPARIPGEGEGPFRDDPNR